MTYKTNVIVIGAGQAGLAMSYQLKKRNIKHVVLEKEQTIASSWRSRYDSLKTITPNWMNSLPGLDFPGDKDDFASREEVIDYIDDYSKLVQAPIQFNCEVQHLAKKDNIFFVKTTMGYYEAQHVIVATGPFQKVSIPDFSRKAKGIYQIHSSEYRNPSQLTGKSVLVVGSGNSGVQIAVELSKKFNVYLSRERDFTLPRKLTGSVFQKILEKLNILDRKVAKDEYETTHDLMWWMQHTGLYEMSVDSPLGKALANGGDPYLGESLETVMSDNHIQGMSSVEDINNNEIIFSDGMHLKPDVVVWATGFKNDYSWIDTPVMDDAGKVVHQEGISPVDGLYFLGLRWMRHADSGLLKGVGIDAEFIVDIITANVKQIA